jgi:hypothetical protein
MNSFERLDARRRDRFADRLRRWAIANPPPRTARQANDDSTPGDRFVAVLTVVAVYHFIRYRDDIFGRIEQYEETP